MEIKDFTDQSIRIGTFPQCVDIQTIPNFHSGDGFLMTMYPYRSAGQDHFFQIRKLNGSTAMCLCILRWEEQLAEIEHLGPVIWDSREVKK